MVSDIKVIFLDVDGVLNSEWFFKNRENKDVDLDESRFPLLKKIVNKTEAKIVLSSTWRFNLEHEGFQQLPKMLAKYNMSIIDYTGRNNFGRGAEIHDWLVAHPEVEAFCILDDDSFDMGEYVENQLVHTSWCKGHGLEEKHVKQAITILNRS